MENKKVPEAHARDDSAESIDRSGMAVELRLTASQRTKAWDALWQKAFGDVLSQIAGEPATSVGTTKEAA